MACNLPSLQCWALSDFGARDFRFTTSSRPREVSRSVKKSCDILIVGGGIIGLAIAHELSKRGIHDVVVLEKEDHLGAHASGRNSGVLHAGLYYSSDSLKARFCSRGAALLK